MSVDLGMGMLFAAVCSTCFFEALSWHLAFCMHVCSYSFAVTILPSFYAECRFFGFLIQLYQQLGIYSGIPFGDNLNWQQLVLSCVNP